MTFAELKNRILEQVKGKKWSLYSFSHQDEISFNEISKLVQTELPNLPKDCFNYRTNNKHMTVYFETYVAQKQIKYPLFDMDVKTKRSKADKSPTSWGSATYDYIISDLVITPLTDYNGYKDREQPDTATFIDFIIDLAKREAAEHTAYRDKAISALQAISNTLCTKDWIELRQMLRYMQDNFSYLYDTGKINQ